MVREPAVAEARRVALEQAADVLHQQAEAIADRWVGRLSTTLYRGRPAPEVEDLHTLGSRLIRGAAEALQSGDPEALPALWAEAAQEHAYLGLRRRVRLGDVAREYRVLHQELWRALQQHLSEMPAAQVYDVAEGLDSALETMITMLTDAYGAELQRLMAQLDAVSASLPDGLAFYDPQAQLVAMSAAAEAMLGFGAREAPLPLAEQLARLHLETAEGIQIAADDTPIVRALRGEVVQNALLLSHRPDGTALPMLVSAAPVRLPDGALLGAVAAFRDVTNLYELEEQREDTLRAISHDLRSPLSAIMAQAELLARLLAVQGHERERASADAIVTSARRMDAMIEDLVDAARLESGQLRLSLQAVDLHAFVSDLLRRLAPAFEMSRAQVEIPARLPPVAADPARLERILTNLLSNALKYSPPTTQVTVTAEQRAGEIVTSVTDRGPGIPPADLPRLFQRYARTAAGQARREGLGLGLYITRLLVQAHGGRIWVESQVGVGSTFSFALPVAS